MDWEDKINYHNISDQIPLKYQYCKNCISLISVT